ncbi:MAG: GIY-YIG nuclease family protein [Candidatus Pacebacteria bacterium]|nr:GIY-YIG nuclease family protein [Candidatus Paceibacterota bacterium]MDD5357208.1 GIY-YIG nuclease family protein [Candidatus Paceibacterota bacterium]
MSISQESLKNLPDLPGVYFFRYEKEILYIGKATSLHDRVKSYFSARLGEARSPLITKMVEKADSIDFQITDSVLEALILEAALIKKHQPKYNTDEKDDKSYNYVVFTKEDFPRILLVRGKNLDSLDYKVKDIFGPFPNGGQLKIALKIIRKIFPYRDTCTPLQGKLCFNAQIGLCPGVCDGRMGKVEYARQITHLKLFFEGKKSTLVRSLEKEMKTLAKNREFEKADKIKKQIFALGHIQDVALLKSDISLIRANKGYMRIEAYDVAHISGTSTVGVMTVVEDGEVKKADYRMFKIRTAKAGSDTGALREVLERRLKHSEWPTANLIVIDGGIAQRNLAEKVLENFGLKTPIINVVKDDRHKPDHFLGDELLARKYKKEILLANSEAHRFAISYHKRVRGKLF